MPRKIKPPVLLAAEVAELLRLDETEFLDRLPRLYAAGFPQPLPELGNRWDRNSVEFWIANGFVF